MTTRHSTTDIAGAARRLLNIQSLRPGQEDAIRSLLEVRDTIVVQPTGYGKSAIYQIAGDLIGGTTLIISPLIALQKDQSDFITQADGLKDAAVVNSTQTISEQREVIERIEGGDVRYVFLAPEQLRKQETIDHLEAAKIALFVIDEAHCISQWGHDFRPDYLQLPLAIEALGHPPVLAMTATASERVRMEISDRLRLRLPRVYVHGFDRPNISLRVDKFSSDSQKREALLRRISFADKPGIVYTTTHKRAEAISAELRQQSIDCDVYHGGMKAEERNAIQDRFMCGDVPVIAATNAFGMGIDKPDIRFVFHADVSDSLDAYYQEIGRAGRDGRAADAVLFFRSSDIGAQRYKTGSAAVNTTELEHLASVLSEQNAPTSREQLIEQSDLSSRKLLNTVHKLEEVGAVKQLPTGDIELTTDHSPAEIAQQASEREGMDREARRERLAQMQGYAECRSCRREYLLRYFGEDYTGPCGNCDNCEAAGVHHSPPASNWNEATG